ncbi:MAG TPA: histidine kinase [Chitinophagaceae bacterium]
MIVFMLVMVTFIITILFFVQKKQRGFTDKLLLVKSSYDEELFKAETEIQEQTLKEISREIHDNVCQLLSLAKLGLGTLNLAKKEEARNSFLEISDILEKAQDELRHLSRTMNSDIISNGGLIKSIETQVMYVQRGGKYNIHLDIEGEPKSLNGTKDTILFRIAQESLNNIIKHAMASEIWISLQYNPQFLKLHIMDNGKGFNLNEQNSGSKMANGILNMQQRAKLINAEFEINSQMSNGTQVTITTPY